jgi:hypothetical protein
MREEPGKGMGKSYASRIIKYIREIEAAAFWDVKLNSIIELLEESNNMH